MTTEPVAASRRIPGAWARFWAWVQTWEDAMETTYDDIQDRRILALEREVAELRSEICGPPAEVGSRSPLQRDRI